ncbi:hypothetical protein VNO77_39372 [Canavalia gladiata]|uniref:Uncharacterized protein n=1 Tax=Canavalia gladiata TaxID=3824 RepID=A0AAN9KAY5_CANGL
MLVLIVLAVSVDMKPTKTSTDASKNGGGGPITWIVEERNEIEYTIEDNFNHFTLIVDGGIAPAQVIQHGTCLGFGLQCLGIANKDDDDDNDRKPKKKKKAVSV